MSGEWPTSEEFEQLAGDAATHYMSCPCISDVVSVGELCCVWTQYDSINKSVFVIVCSNSNVSGITTGTLLLEGESKTFSTHHCQDTLTSFPLSVSCDEQPAHVSLHNVEFEETET